MPKFSASESVSESVNYKQEKMGRDRDKKTAALSSGRCTKSFKRLVVGCNEGFS